VVPPVAVTAGASFVGVTLTLRDWVLLWSLAS
jgi:hypothetical protein